MGSWNALLWNVDRDFLFGFPVEKRNCTNQMLPRKTILFPTSTRPSKLSTSGDLIKIYRTLWLHDNESRTACMLKHVGKNYSCVRLGPGISFETF